MERIISCCNFLFLTDFSDKIHKMKKKTHDLNPTKGNVCTTHLIKYICFSLIMLINVVKRLLENNGIYKTRIIFLAVATGRVKGHIVLLLNEKA